MDHQVASTNCIHLCTVTMTVGTSHGLYLDLGNCIFYTYVSSFDSKQRQQVLCQLVYDYSQLLLKIDNMYDFYIIIK